MKKEFVSFLATGAVLLNALTPLALADTSLQVSGNGAGSTSNVTSTSNNTSSLEQNNKANVNNTVRSDTNTGGNTANENTGGNVTVDTGNAATRTDIRTTANANSANLQNCTSCNGNNGNAGDPSLQVSGNGAFSQNTAKAHNTNETSAFQTNDAYVTNDVTSNARTGNNDANRNTGGDVLVLTGHATNDTALNTAVNANVATTGNNSNGGNNNNNDLASLWISGNGAGSNNTTDLTRDNSLTLVQNNQADVRNRVDSNAKTGNNNANENTDGSVRVDTGNARNTTRVDNLANFNSADLGNCGCETGNALEKVFGNGAFSKNNLNAHLDDTTSVFQPNDANVYNDVTNKGKTGNNDANRNTGDVWGFISPVDVLSGQSYGNTTVRNSSNQNVFGSNRNLQLPGGWNVNFTFDLNHLTGGMN